MLGLLTTRDGIRLAAVSATIIKAVNRLGERAARAERHAELHDRHLLRLEGRVVALEREVRWLREREHRR